MPEFQVYRSGAKLINFEYFVGDYSTSTQAHGTQAKTLIRIESVMQAKMKLETSNQSDTKGVNQATEAQLAASLTGG